MKCTLSIVTMLRSQHGPPLAPWTMAASQRHQDKGRDKQGSVSLSVERNAKQTIWLTALDGVHVEMGFCVFVCLCMCVCLCQVFHHQTHRQAVPCSPSPPGPRANDATWPFVFPLLFCLLIYLNVILFIALCPSRGLWLLFVWFDPFGQIVSDDNVVKCYLQCFSVS